MLILFLGLNSLWAVVYKKIWALGVQEAQWAGSSSRSFYFYELVYFFMSLKSGH